MIISWEKGRRPKLAFCVCVALLEFSSACSQQTPVDTRTADETAIRNMDAQWSKTAGAHDLDGTLAYYSDDASVMASNVPIATGREAIRAIWAPMCVPDASVSWVANKVDVARSGDLAYSIGTYKDTAKDAQGKPETDRGKLLEVWKKQADGKWKVVADIFNSDLPLPAPPEKK
ncbi:MAG TPA: DUF4440 domain-containing protein [Terriglobia bacterium]|nr:DUF4440 domain-containing protein [Terriglobia bacterium]